jgi:hypothetical protein
VVKGHLPHAHFEIFDDLGHDVHVLVPERCTAAVLRFLGTIA